MKVLLLFAFLALALASGKLASDDIPSQEPASEVVKRSSECSDGWFQLVNGKCIYFSGFKQILSWYDSYNFCQAHDAELVTWRSEEEFLAIYFFYGEIINTYPENFPCWTGAFKQTQTTNDWVWNNVTKDLVPLEYGWNAGAPSKPGCEAGQLHDCINLDLCGLDDTVGSIPLPFLCQQDEVFCAPTV